MLTHCRRCSRLMSNVGHLAFCAGFVEVWLVGSAQSWSSLNLLCVVERSGIGWSANAFCAVPSLGFSSQFISRLRTRRGSSNQERVVVHRTPARLGRFSSLVRFFSGFFSSGQFAAHRKMPAGFCSLFQQMPNQSIKRTSFGRRLSPTLGISRSAQASLRFGLLARPRVGVH